MGNISFDEALEVLMNRPEQFRTLWGNNSSLRELRGLHNETLLHFLAIEGEIASVRLLAKLGLTLMRSTIKETPPFTIVSRFRMSK